MPEYGSLESVSQGVPSGKAAGVLAGINEGLVQGYKMKMMMLELKNNIKAQESLNDWRAKQLMVESKKNEADAAYQQGQLGIGQESNRLKGQEIQQTAGFEKRKIAMDEAANPAKIKLTEAEARYRNSLAASYDRGDRESKSSDTQAAIAERQRQTQGQQALALLPKLIDQAWELGKDEKSKASQVKGAIGTTINALAQLGWSEEEITSSLAAHADLLPVVDTKPNPDWANWKLLSKKNLKLEEAEIAAKKKQALQNMIHEAVTAWKASAPKLAAGASESSESTGAFRDEEELDRAYEEGRITDGETYKAELHKLRSSKKR